MNCDSDSSSYAGLKWEKPCAHRSSRFEELKHFEKAKLPSARCKRKRERKKVSPASEFSMCDALSSDLEVRTKVKKYDISEQDPGALSQHWFDHEYYKKLYFEEARK